MKQKILISNAGFGACSPQSLAALKARYEVVENVDGARFDEDRFLSHVQDIHAIIAGTEKISAHVIEKAPQLKLIARVGAGVDSVDLAACAAHKVSITYTPDAPALAVPEFALSLMLNLVRKISASDAALHRGEWLKPTGDSLGDLHVGIVGAGKIGKRVIEMLRALYPGIGISFYDPVVLHIDGAQKVALADLLQQADIVSLHVPLMEATRHLINAQTLKTMKKGSYLVNTARGGVVCDDALYEALTQGHLAGAALDVYEQEPYKGSLRELENCLLTAHIGSLTRQVRAAMEQQVGDDVISFFEAQSLCRPLPGHDFTSQE